MAAKKFLRLVSGVFTEIFGVQTSSGVSNAGDIPALDDTGRLHESLMPVGVAGEVKTFVAFENLSAGNFVNIFDDSGTDKVRKADASTISKKAHGFVLSAYTTGQTATVYYDGANTALTGLVPNTDYYLSATVAGTATATVPTGANAIVQKLGTYESPTELNFQTSQPIVLAS